VCYCGEKWKRKRYEKESYLTLVRQKLRGVYSHAWQLLHQVQGERARGQERGGEVEREGDGASSESAHATVTIESDDSSSQLDAVDSNKFYWGLSTSSYNLARDLLVEPHLHSCDSETPHPHLLTLLPSSPHLPIVFVVHGRLHHHEILSDCRDPLPLQPEQTESDSVQETA
ncbi:hypothetical protein GBAR_LOCUS7521, partial [Geodia barretti]